MHIVALVVQLEAYKNMQQRDNLNNVMLPIIDFILMVHKRQISLNINECPLKKAQIYFVIVSTKINYPTEIACKD